MTNNIKSEVINRANNKLVHPVAFTSEMTRDERKTLFLELCKDARTRNEGKKNGNAPA